MKKTIIAILAAGSCIFANAEQLLISTPSTSMLLDAVKGEPLRILHYGSLLSEADATAITNAGGKSHEAYPAYGRYPEGSSAISVIHPDGNMSLELEVTDVVKTTRPDGGSQTTVKMTDRKYPLGVDINYLTYPGEDVIETWTEITNSGKSPVTLTRFDSGYLPVRYGNVWLSSLHGTWANEAQVEEAPLPHGIMTIKNTDGTRNSHTSHSEVMLSLDGKPSERHGRVIGAALEYTGNYKLRIETDPGDYHHFFAGINEENSAYSLGKGETFTTPMLALTYSDRGLGGASRNFHRWGRNHRLAHGDKDRAILLNSWEGVYFNITEPGMEQMMADIASMGGELFVMDDGWFGRKYKRAVDNAALGDWIVDTDKLPRGLNHLIKTAEKNGIGFGIWIEPEMTNTASELFEKHPDWIVNAPGRDIVKGRGGTQLVLDMGNPEVQDFVFNTIDTLLTSYPDISYIKWDANAPIMSHGSKYTGKNQSHLYIDYHRGFAKVMDRIRAKYPDVVIQACASGGGRANWGFLPWFEEFWTSDNTDALQRVYMQWGTSYFFPAIAMGSHISTAPNHQTFRSIPLKYRIDVAMSGRLGMEIQPAKMTAEEKELCRKAIAEYKQIRPTVQHGDLYRLLSPYDKKGAASLMYVSEDKNEAVFYWWKTETFVGQQLPRVTMDGLDPDKTYRATELNVIDNEPQPWEGKTFSGHYLMENGLEMPLEYNVDYNKKTDFGSRVIRLQAVD